MVDKNAIERFRRDLPIIRAFAGWTLENLAEMLGVSRSTAIHLESKPKTMKTVHVYAINYLIAREMITNQALSTCIDILRRDNVGAFSISRKELIKKVEELKKTVGKKGAKRLKEALEAWMVETL